MSEVPLWLTSTYLRPTSMLGGINSILSRAGRVHWRGRRWRSNPPGSFSQERLTQDTVKSTVRKAAHPPGFSRCDAGAGCSAIKSQLFLLEGCGYKTLSTCIQRGCVSSLRHYFLPKLRNQAQQCSIFACSARWRVHGVAIKWRVQ